MSFALYVTYFPQLVAGPIENARDLLPQLKKEQFWNWDDFSAGIRLLLCGFFRKCVVADFLGIHVNAVFAGVDTANALAIFGGGALFCFQMYCDFAGYSEIAAGAARMMGVRLMRNFDRPYLSQSYTEFFRSWHISLNRWFTSYVYIPLGGSRRGKARKILNTLIVFALCGLWHGARWTYVLWGLYAAFWLCVESLLDINRRFGPQWDNPLGRTARRCMMFLIFVPAALLFRADSLEQLSVIFPRLFTEMGYACVNLDAVPEDQRGNAAAVEQAFRDAVAAMEGVTLAGELEDYVYQNEDFYDTNYHLRSAAAARNTDLWIRDLTAQLDGEGNS